MKSHRLWMASPARRSWSCSRRRSDRETVPHHSLHSRFMKVLLALLFATTTLTAQPIVIRAARVIDGRGHVTEDAAVVVDGSKIVRILPNAKALKNVTFDVGDRTILPGGIDTHVHIGWHFDAKDGRSHDDE